MSKLIDSFFAFLTTISFFKTDDKFLPTMVIVISSLFIWFAYKISGSNGFCGVWDGKEGVELSTLGLVKIFWPTWLESMVILYSPEIKSLKFEKTLLESK